MKKQMKLGIMISYLNLFLNMFVNVFFTPFLISSMGDAEYGVYRIVQSFAGQLTIMTFGIAALVSRNIAYFDEKKQEKEKQNFLAMALIISVIISFITFIAGMVMYKHTGDIFKNSLTADEIIVAKKLILLFVLNISFTILKDFFAGILTGHEKFIQFNLIKTIRFVLRILTLIVLLNLGFKSIAIVATDLALTIGMLLFDIFYSLKVLKEKIHFYYFDKIMFKTSMLFSVAILFQAIITQVNQNLDSFILGIMTDARTVAIYSVALVIYTTYNGIPTVILGVFTPKVTKMIARGATSEQLTDFVSSIGRYQLMLVGAIISGFVLFGKEFLCVWLNPDYLPAYKITLILIIPVTIPLIQNGCNVVLDAQLNRMPRSVILLISAILNVIISVILVDRLGYIGAAYGTALSLIIGNIIIMNIYLSKRIGLNIRKMFSDIFYKILPCIVVAFIVSIPVKMISINHFPWVSIILKLLIFVAVYFIIMYLFGMKQTEKEVLTSIVSKFFKGENKNVQE